MRAQIHHLTLGEFFSDHFCDRLPRLKASPILQADKSNLPGNLRALTLNLNLFGVQSMFLPSSTNGGMQGLRALSQLTSLTLKASEVLPEGGRKKHRVPAEQLLHSLPDSLRSLALHNFRDRWKCFGDLSCRPQLVNLDLTESSCIFPPEAEAWTQLRELHLGDSCLVDGRTAISVQCVDSADQAVSDGLFFWSARSRPAWKHTSLCVSADASSD